MDIKEEDMSETGKFYENHLLLSTASGIVMSFLRGYIRKMFALEMSNNVTFGN